MTPALAFDVERAALRAWPALEVEAFDGWELRWSNGFTRRANSVQVVGSSSMPVDEKVAELERRYAARGRDLRFRLTGLAEPALDALLESRGYARGATVATCWRRIPFRLEIDSHVAVDPAPAQRWLDARLRWSGQEASTRTDLAAIVCRVPGAGFLTAFDEAGRDVGVGMAVVDGDLVGLFGLATRHEARGRGHGTRVVAALQAWGAEHGANTAYLQVAVENESALRLYGSLGFEALYEYWYRERPSTPAHESKVMQRSPGPRG